MTEEEKIPPDADLSEGEREIRTGRKFSLADAIGDAAGSELLRGASPVSRRRQAELQIEHYLENHLEDAEGALQAVLLRRVADSRLLRAADHQNPLAALAECCGQLLGSEPRLREFVTAVDAEWGRLYDERPHFEREGEPPDRDDPYTIGSVRAALARLVASLDGGSGSPGAE